MGRFGCLVFFSPVIAGLLTYAGAPPVVLTVALLAWALVMGPMLGMTVASGLVSEAWQWPVSFIFTGLAWWGAFDTVRPTLVEAGAAVLLAGVWALLLLTDDDEKPAPPSSR